MMKECALTYNMLDLLINHVLRRFALLKIVFDRPELDLAMQ